MTAAAPRRLALLAACVCAVCAACAPEPPQLASELPDGEPASRFAAVYDEPAAPRADLAEIRAAGALRVLLYQSEMELPREGSPLAAEMARAEALGVELGLPVRWVVVPTPGELDEALRAGRGDIVAARPSEGKLDGALARSSPLFWVNEVVAVKRGTPRPPRHAAELAKKSVHVAAETPVATALASAGPRVGVEVVQVGDGLDSEQILARLGAGEYAAAVVYDADLAGYLAYADDVVQAFVWRAKVPMAWTLRATSPKLLEAVNGFLYAADLTRHTNLAYGGDLDDIKKRRVIRVAMLNNSASYFIYRGQQVGFQYELAELLSRRLGVRLEVVVPERPSDLPRLLAEGRADVVPLSDDAAGAERSLPFAFAKWQLVQAVGEDPIRRLDQLAGRAVHVRRSSAYYPLLRQLGVEVVEAPEDLETEELIELVGKKEIPLSVSNSVLLDMEMTFRDDVQGTLVFAEGKPLVWGTRPDAKKLHAAVNRFIERELRGAEYTKIYSKYFNSPKRMQEVRAEDATSTGTISPFDEIVRRYARQYGLDWRLVAAQMYQESKFDPKARSWVGALGLMQLMPRTARELGFRDVRQPEHNIHAGVKYMAKLLSAFEPNIDMRQRVRFALASYNAGLGHVQDARRLARKMSWDPDKWFGNVEKAILLLEKPKYAKRARHGYCRGSEPAAYVSRIQSKYDAYVAVMPAEGTE